MTIRKLYLPQIISDDELKTSKGEFFDSGYIYNHINSDCDVYDECTGKFVCSFRKNRLKQSQLAWDNFKHLSVASRGRGAAAGPIDPTSVYWKKRTLVKTEKFRTSYMVKGNPSKMSVNNQVASTPIGYFEKTKALGIDKPCRLTYHTSQALKEYEAGKPYIHELNKWYQKVRPLEHKIQVDRANLKKEFKIDHTAFSTITMNRIIIVIVKYIQLKNKMNIMNHYLLYSKVILLSELWEYMKSILGYHLYHIYAKN